MLRFSRVAENPGGHIGSRQRLRRPPPVSLAHLLALFLKVGSLGFGGGMAVIALMEREFVQRRKLLTVEEFLHGVGFGQVLGAFSVNAAYFIGYRMYGAVGGLLSAATFLMPSVVLVIALASFYFRYHEIPALQGAVNGLGPVVIALILDAAVGLGRKVLHGPLAFLLAGAALVAGAYQVNAVWILLAAGAIGLLMRRGPDSPLPGDAGPPPAALPLLHIPVGMTHLTLLANTSLIFLKIGFVFFGGGFVLVPVLHRHMVSELGWLTTREFLDGVAISNLTPGPIAVLATFAGYHVAGVSGAILSTAALMAPALALMWVMSAQYERVRENPVAQRFLEGVNPAITGLIVSAVFLLGGSAILSWRGVALSAVSFLLLARFHWHPAFVLVMGAALGYFAILP
ncbi:MAG: chromate efflux transporter [Candidatus Solibacter sp.]